MKNAILGLSNAIVDVITEVKDEYLKENCLKKGMVNNLGRTLVFENVELSTGGCPTNVAINASAAGIACGVIGCVGNDSFGDFYINSLKNNGVKGYLTRKIGKTSTCYVLVTPDKERTSIWQKGTCGDFEITPEPFRNFEIFHTTLYETVTRPEKVINAIRMAKEDGMIVSYDLADAGLVKQNKKKLEYLLKEVDVVFANEQESRAFTGLKPIDAVSRLEEFCKTAVVKLGAKGSLVGADRTYKIAAYPVEVVNTIGAGDAYCAGFLYGVYKGMEPEKCGEYGSRLAARVCSTVKSNLGTPEKPL